MYSIVYMVVKNMPRKRMVFLIRRELTRHAILWSQEFDSIKWPTLLVRKVKGKLHTFEARHVCVDHCNLLLKHLSNHFNFMLSWTNPTDPLKPTFSHFRWQQIIVIICTFRFWLIRLCISVVLFRGETIRNNCTNV